MKKSIIKIVILILAIILVMTLFLCIAIATSGIITYRAAASAIQDNNIQVDKFSLVNFGAEKGVIKRWFSLVILKSQT